VRLGRGPYFGRVLLMAWAAAMVSHPPTQSLALYRLVGCEAVPWVAGPYFAGLQTLITCWAIARLKDAGVSGGWAILTWSGAVPGLAAALGHPLPAAAQSFAYGFGILAILGIGALEPSGFDQPRVAHESLPARYLRRLLLPIVLAQVLVLAPRSDAVTARRLIEDGMRIAPVLQLAVAGYWRSTGELPASNFQAGLPPAEGITGNAVVLSGVEQGGAVFLIFDHPGLPCALRGTRIVLQPEPEDGRLLWHCQTSLPQAARPGICQRATSETPDAVPPLGVGAAPPAPVLRSAAASGWPSFACAGVAR
jgi:uncharacterized membrane protein YhaH (DUF805 family)